jgi:hypothetical protein
MNRRVQSMQALRWPWSAEYVSVAQEDCCAPQSWLYLSTPRPFADQSCTVLCAVGFSRERPVPSPWQTTAALCCVL